jgi:hypothetical protein
VIPPSIFDLDNLLEWIMDHKNDNTGVIRDGRQVDLIISSCAFYQAMVGDPIRLGNNSDVCSDKVILDSGLDAYKREMDYAMQGGDGEGNGMLVKKDLGDSLGWTWMK